MLGTTVCGSPPIMVAWAAEMLELERTDTSWAYWVPNWVVLWRDIENSNKSSRVLQYSNRRVCS